MSLSQDDVIRILDLVDRSNYSELHLSLGDFKLSVRKESGDRTLSPETGCVPEAQPDPIHPAPAGSGHPAEPRTSTSGPAGSDQEAALFPADLDDESLVPIVAPMLGVFYQSPEPDASPFLKKGASVDEDDTACIIEVMKLFTHIKAGVSGRVAEVCIRNGDLVEYNQVLFLVEPA